MGLKGVAHGRTRESDEPDPLLRKKGETMTEKTIAILTCGVLTVAAFTVQWFGLYLLDKLG